LISAAVSVGVGIYLIYALFLNLRRVCWLCLIGHAINVAITGLLMWLKLNG